jgi:hypothetical protein
MKKRKLMFGCLGNGITVCDTLHEKHGDYEKVAHISTERIIQYYVPLSAEDTAKIVKVAESDDPSFSVSQPETKVFKTRP